MNYLRCRPAPARRGLSLIEVVVATAASAVLVTGLTSALYISARSFDADLAATDDVSEAADLMTRLADEIGPATAFTERTATSLAFTVDRGGMRTIRYAWSGTPGDPLTRSVDGGTAANVLPAVDAVAFGYETETGVYDAQAISSTTYEIDKMGSTTSKAELEIDDDYRAGFYYEPDFAADVMSWRITNLQLRIRKVNGDSVGIVVRRAAADHGPIAGDLWARSLSVDSLSDTSFTWVDFDFTGSPGFARDEAIVILVDQLDTDTPVAIEYRESGHSESRYHLIESEDGGLTFDVDKFDQCPRFKIDAEVFTAESVVSEVTLLRGVTAAVTPAGSPPLRAAFPLHAAIGVAP